MTKEQAVQWLFAHKDQEGSPEFERVLAQYQGLSAAGGDPLEAAKSEYAKVEAQPDSDEKNAALDALRTKISDLGGNPPLSKGPMVTQKASESTETKEKKPKSELPSQADFDEYVQEARKAQLLGGAAAATKYLPEVTQRVLGPTVGALSQAVEEGRMRAQPPARSALPTQMGSAMNPAAGSALTPVASGSPAGFGSYGAQTVVDRTGAVVNPRAPVQPTMDQLTRQVQGTIKEPGTSMATTGRASQTAYQARTSDIAEAKRAQQAALEALGRKTVLGPVPQGITGSSPTGILVPPAALEPVPPPQIGAAGVEPRIGPVPPEGPYVNPQTLRALPMATTAPPPVASGLDQVRQTFTRLANTPVGQQVSRAASVLGKGAGALGTVGAGSEVGLNLYDMIDALEKQKYGQAAMSGAKAAAMGASIMTPYGLIPAALLYGADWLGDATARAKAKATHGMTPRQAFESEGGFYSANQ